MDSRRVGPKFRRRSGSEAERLVSEFEQSGLRRKEFCAVHGLSVHTLDAWRRRIGEFGSDKKIVPVEIVEGRAAGLAPKQAENVERSGQFRVVLSHGVRIEIEYGFDAGELRRLIAALDGGDLRDCLSRPV